MWLLPVIAVAAPTGNPDGRSVAPHNEGTAELFFSVEQLKQEVLELRGLVEELQHKVSVMQKQDRERYIDLDRRLQSLSRSPVSAPASAGATPTTEQQRTPSPVQPYVQTSAPSADEQAAYQKAYALIKESRYDDAIDALHDFIARYPDGDLTANAYYWLGEVYLVAPKLEQAKAAFTVVINKFPKHRKAADALYKLGVVYQRMGRNEEAGVYLKKVIETYPDSSAARLAAKALAE